MDLLNWRIPYMDNTHSSWPSLIRIVLFRIPKQRYPRDGSSYSDIYDQEVLDSLSDRPWKEKEGWNANRRILLNLPDRIVPILETSSAKVTEWGKSPIPKTDYVLYPLGYGRVFYRRFVPCVIPVEAYTRGVGAGWTISKGIHHR